MKKKIAFVLGGFQGSGGIGRVVSILVNQLKKRNFDVITISFFDQHKEIVYDIDQQKNYYLFDEYTSMTKALASGQAVKRLRKILTDESVGIVIACGVLFYPMAYFATRFSKTKLIFWEHTNFSVNSDYKFQKTVRKTMLNKADMVVCLTKKDIPNYQTVVDSSKLIQIYNPVDGKIKYCADAEAEKKRILSVGRLSYPKNYEETIEIAKRVFTDHPDWRWDIYGEGPEKETLSALIKKANLEGKVNLMGRRSDIYRVYPEYDIMAMTSRYEGFPMALLEGMASGIPLISYDIETGPSEIIEENTNGFLIENLDRETYVKRLRELVDDKKKRVRFSQGNKNVYPKFSIKDIVDQWCELFVKLDQKGK